MNHRKSPSELEEKLGWTTRLPSCHSTHFTHSHTALYSSTSLRSRLLPLSFLFSTWALYTYTHTQTRILRHMQSEIHTRTQTNLYTKEGNYTHIHTEIHTCPERDTQTDTEIQRHTLRKRQTHKEMHTRTHTHRHTKRHTQGHIPTHRDTRIERHIHAHFLTTLISSAPGGKIPFSWNFTNMSHGEHPSPWLSSSKNRPPSVSSVIRAR